MQWVSLGGCSLWARKWLLSVGFLENPAYLGLQTLWGPLKVEMSSWDEITLRTVFP